MNGPKITTAKCCKNCKYYQIDPYQQPWEAGCPDYVCTKHDKSVREDNYCACYKKGKQK